MHIDNSFIYNEQWDWKLIKTMNKEMGEPGKTKSVMDITGKVADPYPSC